MKILVNLGLLSAGKGCEWGIPTTCYGQIVTRYVLLRLRNCYKTNCYRIFVTPTKCYTCICYGPYLLPLCEFPLSRPNFLERKDFTKFPSRAKGAKWILYKRGAEERGKYFWTATRRMENRNARFPEKYRTCCQKHNVVGAPDATTHEGDNYCNSTFLCQLSPDEGCLLYTSPSPRDA